MLLKLMEIDALHVQQKKNLENMGMCFYNSSFVFAIQLVILNWCHRIKLLFKCPKVLYLEAVFLRMGFEDHLYHS